MNDLADAEGYNTTGRMLLVLDRGARPEVLCSGIVAHDIGMDVLAVEFNRGMEEEAGASAAVGNIAQHRRQDD
jgi:hypothetical protein